MDTRKLQVSGHSTYLLSLPKSWVKTNNIQKGDKVRLRLQPDGTILLTPEYTKRHHHEIELVIKDNSESLFRKFIGMYLAGYQVIHLKYDENIDHKRKREIKDLIRRISGLEILDEKPDGITMQDLLDSSLFSPEKALKRMHLLVRNMLRDTVRALENGDGTLVKDITSRDNEVDRLYWLVTRQYNLILQDIWFSEKLSITPQQGLGFLLMARALESIADHSTKIASKIGEQFTVNDDLNNEIEKVVSKLVTLMESSVMCFFSPEFDESNRVLKEAQGIQVNIDRLIESKVMEGEEDRKALISYAYILDSLSRICSYTKDISEISINNHYLRD